MDAYNRILLRYPDDVRALSNLGAVHAARREYAVQESPAVRAMAVDSGVPSLYTALAYANVNQGDYDAAPRAREGDRRFLTAGQSPRDDLARGVQAGTGGGGAEARARVAQAADDSSDALDRAETLASIVMAQGRLAEAEQSLRRVAALGGAGRSARRSLAAAPASRMSSCDTGIPGGGDRHDEHRARPLPAREDGRE